MTEQAPPTTRRVRVLQGVRRRKERHAERGRAYRISFATIGFLLVATGVLLSLPLVPGPGIPLIVAGLAMLALEFDWAERLLDRTLHRAETAGKRASDASRAQKALGGIAGMGIAAAAVAALVIWGPW